MASVGNLVTTNLSLSNFKAPGNGIDLGVVNFDPIVLAGIFSDYIIQGSKVHSLNRDQIKVYANIINPFVGKEDTIVQVMGEHTVACTIPGLMAAGTKFMDAVAWLCIKPENRPLPLVHKPAKDDKMDFVPKLFNVPSKLCSAMFFYYFYIIIRARAPEETTNTKTDPIPAFLSKVLGISETANEVAEYLSSFPLKCIDPAWVKHIDMKAISRESVSRFGLGVAGYRLCSPFKLAKPKEGLTDDLKEAIIVATSFTEAMPCWDFHPATRNPEIIAKYGNINKNLGNLILEVFDDATIDMLVKNKTIFSKPVHDPTATQYRNWNKSMCYKATRPIFPSA